MKLYGGIDLHSNNLVAAVLDEQDKVVYRVLCCRQHRLGKTQRTAF